MRFGFWPPFAQRGVPEIVSMTSWSIAWAERDRLVDVVEAIDGVERVGRLVRPLRCDEVPLHEEPDDRRAVARGAVDPHFAVVDPAVARVVVEADPHALGGHGRRRQDGSKHGQDQGKADCASHVGSRRSGDEGRRANGTRTSRHPSGSSVSVVLEPVPELPDPTFA